MKYREALQKVQKEGTEGKITNLFQKSYFFPNF